MTCPSDNQLAELVDGSLAGGARVSVEQHLDRCDLCAQLVAERAWVVGGGPVAPAGYRFVRELGEGVFEALDHADRYVIVELGSVDKGLATVRHPGVATIREIGDGFVAYEHLTTTLRAWSETASPARRLAAWTQVLRGLAAIHRAGVVHGRVSPDHVFVEGDRVVIGGFARPLARTAGYLAAEALEGKPASARSDQLGACVALYESLADFTVATDGRKVHVVAEAIVAAFRAQAPT
jgi:hypothetical protein